MELLQYLLPGPPSLHLENYAIDTSAHQLVLSVSSSQVSGRCPLCARSSQRIHSHYTRGLADLPFGDFELTLVLRVCKFFCDNPNCNRRIFTEQVSEIAAPWGRKTVRLVRNLQAIGLALGGAAGARFCSQLGYSACRSTLLNHLQNLSLPVFETPKILGVDDFAFRKGRKYGTILVDLENNRPIALLSDRKAETLADWLIQHPGVKILSRDRSKTYRSGMDEGAPDAIQVADRYHLTNNLGEVLETFLDGYGAALKTAEEKLRRELAPTGSDTVIVVDRPTATLEKQQKTQDTYQKRLEQHRKLWHLHEENWLQKDIAQEVGVSAPTVSRVLGRPKMAETPFRHSTFGVSILDPYKAEILEWWNTGIRQTQILMLLLQKKGYTGSLRTLQRYLSRLCEAQGLPRKRAQAAKDLPTAIDPQLPPFTARRAAFLILQKESNRDTEDTKRLEYLVAQHPNLAAAVNLADEFLELLRQRQADDFDTWLMKALKSTLKPFQKFAKGLVEDYAAVKASMMLEVSNGPVEGLINRLKMLKRQMYGRAEIELLSKRFIMAL